MLTIRKMCHHYLEARKYDLAESTKKTTERAARYLAEALGNRLIDRMGTSEVEDFKKWLIDTGRSKNTANIYLRSLSPVFRWAAETKKLIEHNPLGKVKQFRVTPNPIRVYEDWEFGRMLKYCPNVYWQRIFWTARTTGLRRGAILNLNRDNIRGDFIYVEAKKKTAQSWPWQPKDREARKVPLAPELAELLNGDGQFYVMLSGRVVERMLVLNQAGLLTERRCNCPDQNFRRTFVRIQHKAFGRQIGDFHNLRKTYTTEVSDVFPEHFVKRLTGISSSKTLTHYLAVRESYYEMARQIASNVINMGHFGKPRFAKRRLA